MIDDVAGAVRARRKAMPRVRRWLWVVAGSLLMVAMVPVGAAGLWLLRGTAEASQGGASPYAAVDGALGGLDPWGHPDLIGTGRYLSREHFGELRARLLALRHLLVDGGHGYRLVLFDSHTTADGDRAVVTVNVAVELPITVGGNTGQAMTDALPWTFRTVLTSGLGSGWKVDGFDAPPLCEVYIECGR
jgi:hypothetical protein